MMIGTVLRLEQDTLKIDRETFIQCGIDPQEVIDYILEKKAVDLRPIHVTSLHFLKPKPAVASS